MQQGNDRQPTIPLPGGEVLEVDGSTVPDPETGDAVPAAILRLPAWRVRELSAALGLWSTVMTFFTDKADGLPLEHELSHALADAADRLGEPTIAR